VRDKTQFIHIIEIDLKNSTLVLFDWALDASAKMKSIEKIAQKTKESLQSRD
tara:strand:- start:205 stop:360 length:156 start_codon:yes stop_codon:yes gene_type:complete